MNIFQAVKQVIFGGETIEVETSPGDINTITVRQHAGMPKQLWVLTALALVVGATGTSFLSVLYMIVSFLDVALLATALAITSLNWSR